MDDKKNSISLLIEKAQKDYSWSREILDEMDKMFDPHDGYEDGYEYRRSELEDQMLYCLRRLYDTVIITLEFMGLVETRRDLISWWASQDEKAIKKIYFFQDGEVHVNDASGRLSDILDTLRCIAEPAQDPGELRDIQRLEYALRQLPRMMAAGCQSPDDEHDVQRVLNHYLERLFSSYKTDPVISAVMRDQRPDSGILDLEIGIEVKFVRNVDEVSVAVNGVLQDTASYRGSTHWNKFYAVFYMNGPYADVEQIEHMLRQANAPEWRVVVAVATNTESDLTVAIPNNRRRRKRSGDQSSPQAHHAEQVSVAENVEPN